MIIQHRKGWYRLSLLISVVLLVFLAGITWKSLPDSTNIYKDWYDEINYCNRQENIQKSLEIYSSSDFINAVDNDDYPKLVSLLESNIKIQNKYFTEHCNPDKKTVCDNYFHRFDCPYFFNNTKYFEMTKVIYSQQKGIIIFSIALYVAYLALLLSFWWVCMGFVRNSNDN